MNDRIDERKVSKYLYEIAGRAGTICGHNKLWHEPEYAKAQRLYLTLSDTELEARLEPTLENITHQSGSVIQWGPYLRLNERAYVREYLKSDEWKRKRDIVMRRAMQWFIPASPVIRRIVDKYGRVIEWIDNVEHRPTCENDGCTNEAKEVHPSYL